MISSGDPNYRVFNSLQGSVGVVLKVGSYSGTAYEKTDRRSVLYHILLVFLGLSSLSQLEL